MGENHETMSFYVYCGLEYPIHGGDFLLLFDHMAHPLNRIYLVAVPLHSISSLYMYIYTYTYVYFLCF